MTFDDYQTQAESFVLKNDNPDIKQLGTTIMALGIAGEAGEVVDKWKKILAYHNGNVTDDDKHELAKEIGDTLWYLATFAERLGLSLGDIAQQNIDKLTDRTKRDRIRGKGDNR